MSAPPAPIPFVAGNIFTTCRAGHVEWDGFELEIEIREMRLLVNRYDEASTEFS